MTEKDDCQQEALPVFEVRVGDRHYKIWASGRAMGFAEPGQSCVVVNRIPVHVRTAIIDAQERQICLLKGRDVGKTTAPAIFAACDAVHRARK